MKSQLFVKTLAVASLIAVPGIARASDGTITFSGAVTSSTCSVSLNGGSASGTVTLPTVSTSALGSSGAVAGQTAFALSVSGCTFAGGNTGVTAYFEGGANVDPLTGRLNSSGAANVQLQLYLGSSYTSKIAAGQSSQNAATPLTASGQLNYGVEYYANGGAAGAGAVSSSVTYSLVYS